MALTPRTFEPPEPAASSASLRGAWDIIADQPPTDVVLRFAPSRRRRVGEATWHPTQRSSRSRTARCAGGRRCPGTIEIRLWILSWGDDVEVLAPPSCGTTLPATLTVGRATRTTAMEQP